MSCRYLSHYASWDEVYYKILVRKTLISIHLNLQFISYHKTYILRCKRLLISRHPNINSETWAICLDILKNNWTPSMNLITALISLQVRLSVPEPNDSQDYFVAEQVRYLLPDTYVFLLPYFSSDSTYSFLPCSILLIMLHLLLKLCVGQRTLPWFHRPSIIGRYAYSTHIQWIKIGKYYSCNRNNNKTCWLQVQKLTEMGFSEALVKKTLEAVGGHVNVAIEKLCS